MALYDTKAAKQSGKGAPRDGCARDVSIPKGAATRSYETNPAKGKDVGRGTSKVVGKLGS
jgi:hypothetical protein